MAAEHSDKSPYESKYGGGWVTAAQYFCEVIVARQFFKENGYEPPQRFWTEKKWGKEFARQSKHANELLDKFPHPAIAKALRDDKGKKIYSLGAKSVLEPIIEKYVVAVEHREVQAGSTIEQPRQSFGSGKFGKLSQL